MKKLLAALIAALIAIGSGVEYIKPKEDLYAANTTTASSYWEPEVVDRDGDSAYFYSLYRSVFQVTDNSSPRCNTDTVVPVRSGQDAYKWIGNDLFWFIQEDQGADNGGSSGQALKPPALSGTLSTGPFRCSDCIGDSGYCYITTPCYGEIITSHFACDYGQELKFQFQYQGSTWIMHIKGAVCWWCCRDKRTSSGQYLDKGTYSANTKESLKGKTMAAGALLCVGDSGTTITFTKVS